VAAMSEARDRFERQAELVPADALAPLSITVIGVGAIGRQVALQLASIGAANLQLVDFDHVEASNVTTQGYRRDQIGRPKVQATADDLAALDASLRVQTLGDRFRPQHRAGEVVFACVDSISARRAIWRQVRSRCRLWIDGRMRGEVVRVLASDAPAVDESYATSLFAASQAHTGSCTSASTVYTAALAAGLMVHQLTRWLRRLPIDRDQTLNLLASELTLA
jgi:sulfur carrier protein ThiS adenylyltransferase